MCQMNRWPFSVALMGWVRKGICKKALLCEGWALSLRSWNSLSCVLGQAVFRSPPEENGGSWLDVDSSFSQTFLIQGNLVRTRGNVTDVPYPPPFSRRRALIRKPQTGYRLREFLLSLAQNPLTQHLFTPTPGPDKMSLRLTSGWP